MIINEFNTNGRNLIAQRTDTRWGAFRFRHAAVGFLLGLFVFPPYFGIRLGFDLTVLRFFEFILLIMICCNRIRLKQFIGVAKGCKQTIFIALYFLIVCYTNILRRFAINGILYTFFNWVLVFYLVLYLIQFEFGVSRFIKIVKACLGVVCALSLMELVLDFSPFLILETLGGKVNTNARFGTTRIMGNSGTPNGFGLYLMLLLPLAAYDQNNRQIDIFKNKWLVLAVLLCGLLTGNRVSAGAAVLELCLLVIFSPRKIRGKTVVYGVIALCSVFCLAFLLQDILFFRTLLLTFFSAVDEVLDTQISSEFGANTQSLYHSSHYRELMWKGVFIGTWLQPLLGQGTEYHFQMYIDGYLIQSIDNFYVGQFVTYAYPGLIAWLMMAVSFLWQAIRKMKKHLIPLCAPIIVSAIGYFITLWYLDQLGTFPIMMALFALSCCSETAKG